VLRIESHELGACIFGGELPINASLDSPVQALPGEQAQFDFGDVQPTVMF